MGSGRPQRTWSRAVAVARSLDDDHPVPFRQPVHQAADREILDQGAIPVNEHEGLTLATLEVVQAHAIDVEKATDGRVSALGVARLLDRIQRSSAQGCHRAEYRGDEPAPVFGGSSGPLGTAILVR